MKLTTILILAASLTIPGTALASPPAHTPHPEHDCSQTCGNEDAPAGKNHPAARPAVQPVARQASPGNKFPLPAGRVVEQRPSAGQRAGTLAVRAIQGTPGATTIGSVPIEVELYHRGTHMDTIEVQLDEHGVALIEDLPVAMGLQPFVKIAYAGVTYQKVGEVMDGTRPHQLLEVLCYEVTEEQPPWKIRMRHVMVSLAPDGVEVTEMVVLENPTDRTWIGKPRGDEKAITTEFLLPPGALQATLGRGFHEWCCTTLGKDRLENHLPLTPGSTEMIYAYFLPVRNGSITLDIATLVDVDHLMLMVPDSLKSASYSGLSPAGADTIGDMAVRMYIGSSLGSDQPARIVLTGLGGDEALASGTIAKAVAGVGGGLILIVAGFLIFARSPKTTRSTSTLPAKAPAAS